MDGYLSKPFSRADLIKMLAVHLPGCCGRAEESASRAKFKEVLERFGGDESVLREAAACFVQESPKLMESIRSAVKSGDCAQLVRPAHTLKGSISYFDSGEAFTTAGKLEDAARKNESGSIREMMEVLENRMGELQSALGRILEEVQS